MHYTISCKWGVAVVVGIAGSIGLTFIHSTCLTFLYPSSICLLLLCRENNVCLFLFLFSIKKGSASIHPILGGVILQFVAAILGSVLLVAIVIQSENGFEDLPYDFDGIKWAVCAGAAVGAAEILSFIVSGMGVQAMQSIPIIIGGSVLFGTIMGATILGESLTTRGWGGVLLIAMGIALVGIDPGCSLH